MKYFSLFFAVIFSLCAIAQNNSKVYQWATVDTNIVHVLSDWDDTSYTNVNLLPLGVGQKVVMINIGEKAIIYLSVNAVKQSAVQLQNDFNKKEISKIVQIINKVSAKRDTVVLEQYLPDLDYLVSTELKKGNASIYYTKTKSFVPVISHRLEKYGMYAYRFFYLPDNRPFYTIMEYSGIIENNKYMSDPKEIMKLAEKLADMRKE